MALFPQGRRNDALLQRLNAIADNTERKKDVKAYLAGTSIDEGTGLNNFTDAMDRGLFIAMVAVAAHVIFHTAAAEATVRIPNLAEDLSWTNYLVTKAASKVLSFLPSGIANTLQVPLIPLSAIAVAAAASKLKILGPTILAGLTLVTEYHLSNTNVLSQSWSGMLTDSVAVAGADWLFTLHNGAKELPIVGRIIHNLADNVVRPFPHQRRRRQISAALAKIES